MCSLEYGSPTQLKLGLKMNSCDWEIYSAVPLVLYWNSVSVAPTPLFTRVFLHSVQKQCIKGPPLTIVLSSISNFWVRFCIQNRPICSKVSTTRCAFTAESFFSKTPQKHVISCITWAIIAGHRYSQLTTSLVVYTAVNGWEDTTYMPN